MSYRIVAVALLSLSALCSFAPASLAQLPKRVLVTIFQAHPQQRSIKISGHIMVLQPPFQRILDQPFDVATRGSKIALYRSGTMHGAPLVEAPRFRLSSVFGPITVQFSPTIKRTYRGDIVIERDSDSTLRLLNDVSAQDYVTSVVGSETNPDFPLEELKAQSVLAQTLLSRYKRGDSLSDTTEKEAYLGSQYERESVKQAVSQTWNQILRYQGQPATVYFHSACAGGTSDGEKYFALKPGAHPYLQARDCSFCKGSPFWSEKVSVIPANVFRAKFGSNNFNVASKDERGRPISIDITNGASKKRMNGFAFWTDVGSKLGWDKVPGTRYSVETHANGDVVFRSTGAGHGVGLCQWGAAELAKEGKNYRQILNYYFPGTTVDAPK